MLCVGKKKTISHQKVGKLRALKIKPKAFCLVGLLPMQFSPMLITIKRLFSKM